MPHGQAWPAGPGTMSDLVVRLDDSVKSVPSKALGCNMINTFEHLCERVCLFYRCVMDIGGIRTALAVVAQGSPPEADDELAEQVVALIKTRHLVDHVLSVWVGALDRRGVAKRSGESSTASLLMAGGLAPGCAHLMVRVGRPSTTTR